MKRLLLTAAFALATSSLFAQWQTTTYPLKGGWNAIWLHGDATHTTPSELFKNSPQVLEVWRWNPNPNQVGFVSSPSDPASASTEWTIWRRDDPNEQQLSALIGQSAYLVRCAGDASATINVSIPQIPRPPRATWLIAGANLIGFPANSASRPRFSNYFASFPTPVTAPSKIYKYIGGELSATNPFQISATAEMLDRNTAYWFEAATVGDFTAPVEYETPDSDGLGFGRSNNLLVIGVKNRSSSALTLTFTLQNSEPAPAGETAVTGPVPLTRRTLDVDAGAYIETPVVGAFTVSVPANGRTDVEFGIDRSQLGGDASAHYASILRVVDSASLSEVYLPVSAQVSTPAGLWLGEINIDSVTSTVAGSPGSTTSRPFPLRVILHVDATGTARLLSQAFVGTLATPGNPLGVALKESALLASDKADAMRVSSSSMPLDRAIVGTGAFAIGSTLQHTVSIAFDDPTNPFVHAYHPDHDNRDARLQPLPAGVESYNITRQCVFTFTAQPATGSTPSGWGTTIFGGTYSETIHGINRQPLTVGGTFTLRRLSEIADITLD